MAVQDLSEVRSSNLDRTTEPAAAARCPECDRTVIKKLSSAKALQKRHTCPECDRAYGVSLADEDDFERAESVSAAVQSTR